MPRLPAARSRTGWARRSSAGIRPSRMPTSTAATPPSRGPTRQLRARGAGGPARGRGLLGAGAGSTEDGLEGGSGQDAEGPSVEGGLLGGEDLGLRLGGHGAEPGGELLQQEL